MPDLLETASPPAPAGKDGIRLRVLSLGAGVQSTSLALMAAHGEIGPMPDCAAENDGVCLAMREISRCSAPSAELGGECGTLTLWPGPMRSRLIAPSYRHSRASERGVPAPLGCAPRRGGPQHAAR
jgi:hypothetical protein